MGLETKNRWARDDPAFVLLQSVFLAIMAFLYGLVYSKSVFGIIKLILYMVIVDYYIVGIAVASFTWYLPRLKFNNSFYLLRFVSNKFLVNKSAHMTEQQVEWVYAWDVHCNAFFPTFLCTYVIQFILLGIVTLSGFLPRLIGCTIYFCGIVSYMYYTFLGFQGMLIWWIKLIQLSFAICESCCCIRLSNWSCSHWLFYITHIREPFSACTQDLLLNRAVTRLINMDASSFKNEFIDFVLIQ